MQSVRTTLHCLSLFADPFHYWPPKNSRHDKSFLQQWRLKIGLFSDGLLRPLPCSTGHVKHIGAFPFRQSFDEEVLVVSGPGLLVPDVKLPDFGRFPVRILVCQAFKYKELKWDPVVHLQP